jgi:hypothetical protein
MDCQQASRAQSEQLDHPLTGSTRTGLWFHLLYCKWCRRYGQQIKFLHRTAHENQDKLADTSPKRLSDDARERMKRRLQGEKNP